jgi:hypothetical protein
MAKPNPHASDELKREPDDASLAGDLLRPKSNTHHESTTSIKDLLRSLARGEDPQSTPVTSSDNTVEASGQESGSTGVKVSVNDLISLSKALN